MINDFGGRLLRADTPASDQDDLIPLLTVDAVCKCRLWKVVPYEPRSRCGVCKTTPEIKD